MKLVKFPWSQILHTFICNIIFTKLGISTGKTFTPTWETTCQSRHLKLVNLTLCFKLRTGGGWLRKSIKHSWQVLIFLFPTVNQNLLKVSYLKYMKMMMAKRRDMMETE